MSALEKEITDARSRDGAPDKAVATWAEKTLETLKARSPTSIRVACRQMQLGPKWSIANSFQSEYILAHKFMEHPDFEEGVTARLIEKPRRDPHWQTINEEDDTAKLVDDMFRFENHRRLPLLSSGVADYHKYPWAEVTGLPTEKMVEGLIKQPYPLQPKMNQLRKSREGGIFAEGALGPMARAVKESLKSSVTSGSDSEGATTSTEPVSSDSVNKKNEEQGGITRRKIIDYFLRKTDHKMGVEERVTEILKRKTKIISPEDGKEYWDDELDYVQEEHAGRPLEKSFEWQRWRCFWVD